VDLQPDELRTLHLGLADAFRTENELTELTLSQGLDTPLETITKPDAIPAMTTAVIRYFDSRGMSRALVHSAMTLRPRKVTIQTYGAAILKRLDELAASTLALPADRYEACLIEPGPRSFISRKILRDFMRKVNQPGGHPVLAVNGLSKMGKSYSFEFITYLKRHLQQFFVGWIDLKQEPVGDYKPEEMVRDLALQLGWNTDTLKPSNRFGKDAARWVIGQWNQRQTAEPLVIVLDGFHPPDLHGPTREFVQELIRQVAANTSLVRLVLLNYGPQLLPPGLPPIAHETVARLSRPEMVDFFRAVAKLTKQSQAPTPAVIDQIVDRVLNQVPPNTPNYNEVVNQRATEAAQELLR
jgi:hypothetical protein